MIFLKAQKHSKRVRIFKLVLPITAFALASVLSLVAFSPELKPGVIITTMLNAEDGQPNKLVMIAPKIEGYTNDNKLYALEAVRAVKDPQNVRMIDLEDVKAVLPFGDRGLAIVDAQGGIFDNASKMLQFHHPFTVQTSDGMIAYFLSADISMETSQLKTMDKIEISNKTESLTADSMCVLDNGRVIVFDGSVKLLINHSMEQ